MKLCVVGVGNFGRLHAATAARLPGVELTAVCDPDEERRRAVMETVGTVREFDRFEDCLARADVDAVLLATPEHEHAHQAIQAMEHGWHVFIEKPLALSVSDARAVLAAARTTGRVAMVGTILRFSLPHRHLAERLRMGDLGRIVHVRAARFISRAWFDRVAVHLVFRASVHDIDQVLWLTGRRVLRVAAAGHRLSGQALPHMLAALLWMEDGSTAAIETHFLLPPSFPRTSLPHERAGTRRGFLEITGTAGIARLDEAAGLQLWTDEGVHRPDPFIVPSSTGVETGALRAELEHFATCVVARTPSPICPLSDSVHAVAVAEAIVRAIDTASSVTVEGDDR